MKMVPAASSPKKGATRSPPQFSFKALLWFMVVIAGFTKLAVSMPGAALERIYAIANGDGSAVVFATWRHPLWSWKWQTAERVGKNGPIPLWMRRVGAPATGQRPSGAPEWDRLVTDIDAWIKKGGIAAERVP